MLRLLSAILLSFAVTASLAGPFDLERQTTVKIYNKISNGSAVIVAPNRILTAAHVAVQPNLLVNGSTTSVLKIDNDLDLALMYANVQCPCVSLGDTVSVDDPVVAVGYPINRHVRTQILTEGRAQSRIPDERRLQTSVPISGGNSGGGLYKDHKLVGIMVEGVGLEHDKIVIPISYLSRAVDIDSIKQFLIGTDVNF